MKRLIHRWLFALLFFCFISGIAMADNVISVNFESGIPVGWTATGITVKKDNNSMRAAMSSNATLISPALDNPTQVSYKHRGSGNNKELIVEKSTDGGNTWTQIGSTKVSSSSSYGASGHSIGEPASVGVLIRFTCKSATIYIDDIEISYVNLSAEPTKQASLEAVEVTGNSVRLNIAPGGGAGHLLAYAEGEYFSWTPTDGMSYTGSFPKKVGNATLVSSDSRTYVETTGLQPGLTYTFAAFTYNGDGETRNYLTTEVKPITVSTLTVPTITLYNSVVDFKKTKVGGYKEKQATFSAQYLTPESGTITIRSACEDITISTDGSSFASSVTLEYSHATVKNTAFTIRFSPASYQSYSHDIEIEGGEASACVTIQGTGADSENYDYYIAPDGDDETGDGSIDHPWMNLQHAVNQVKPGDAIICRGGRYHFTARDGSGKLTVRIKTSGTADAPITIRNYDGETPIFDFEQQLIDCGRDRSKVGDRGIHLTGDYWHLYGLHITHAADNGIKLEGSHNRIERCEFSYNLDTGLQLGFGHDFSDSGFGSKNDGSYCAYNDIIDCDSHHNCDFDTNYGSDADGFACKMHNGKGNRFIRCRAWRNSDDAWDLYETDFSVYMIECWAWESGNAEDHTWVHEYFDQGPNFSGNGNGIKLGGNGTGGSSMGVHYVYNCVAFGCDKSGSTKGFDCNHHKDGHVIIGGLAFDNGYDYMFESGGGANSLFYNNVCFGRQEILVGTESHNAFLGIPQQGKTFYNQVVTGFSRSDYESLSEADALAPRGTDGSLPTRFARLKSGSKLVDAGIDKTLPFTDEFPFILQSIYGNGRDLGPYELQEGSINTGAQSIITHHQQTTFALLPGRHDGEVVVRISSELPGAATLHICHINGLIVLTQKTVPLEPGVEYCFPINTSQLSKGIYLIQAKINGQTITRKMIL